MLGEIQDDQDSFQMNVEGEFRPDKLHTAALVVCVCVCARKLSC